MVGFLKSSSEFYQFHFIWIFLKLTMSFAKEIISNITHQDIYNFPFPYKLWIAVNSIACGFIKWNIDGTQIEVQLIALDNYLSNQTSIFKIKSRSSFVTHLRGYEFQQTRTEFQTAKETPDAASPASEFAEATSISSPKYSEIIMHFSHMYFQRHRIDLLANIRQTNHTTSVSDNMAGEKKGANRFEGDVCFRRIGFSSMLSRAHFKHQLILNFLSETKALEAKLKASELKSNIKKQEGNDEDSMIELSAELFENPHDSVLYMGEEHRNAYAGFYGNCTNEQVLKFFGDYLPMYESSNINDEGEKRIANLKLVIILALTKQHNIDKYYPYCREDKHHNMPFLYSHSGKASPPSNSLDINILLNEESKIASDDIVQHNISLPSTSSRPPQQNVSLQSTLEPIFIPDEEKDEDILMDDFIKFKQQTENQAITTEIIDETDIKMEEPCNKPVNEDNEDNFKNFFNHYRESLNLLYEKQ